MNEPKDQLPATIASAEVTADQRALNVVPALIADLGDEAAWRYVEFFTANIRNPNTRRAYVRACNRFFAWCDDRGLTPASIRPHDVATYIEQLQDAVSAPSVKQQLAAVRMLFDWLVIGQVVPTNPAAAFLCADLIITPEPRADHAAYIASWLAVLKNDSAASSPPQRMHSAPSISCTGCRSRLRRPGPPEWPLPSDIKNTSLFSDFVVTAI